MGKEIKKYYAVKKGLKPGIYQTWAECKAQVHKIKGALYKSFFTLSEAEEFLKSPDKKENNANNSINPTYAYIDGSYNKHTKYYGYGGFIMHNNNKYIIKGKGNEPNLSKMRNVAGEIIACKETIKKAIELGIKDIDIFYDYSCIECWATGEYRRNKKETQEYHEFIKSVKDKININFRKVKGHSGNEGNDEADKIAKEACGVKDSSDESFYDYDNDDEKKEPEKNKEIDNKNKNNISLAEIKHMKKNEIRKNEINKIESFNDKSNIISLFKKKLFHESLKKFVEKEKEKEKKKENEENEQNEQNDNL